MDALRLFAGTLVAFISWRGVGNTVRFTVAHPAKGGRRGTALIKEFRAELSGNQTAVYGPVIYQMVRSTINIERLNIGNLSVRHLFRCERREMIFRILQVRGAVIIRRVKITHNAFQYIRIYYKRQRFSSN